MFLKKRDFVTALALSCLSLSAQGAFSRRGSTEVIGMLHWRTTIWGAAADAGSTRLETLLNRSSTEVDAKDGKGNTPLLWAASVGNVHAATLLLAKNASPKAANLIGDTPLHRAALADPNEKYGEKKYLEMVTLLLDHGADPLSKNLAGKTPVDVAQGDIKALLRKRTTHPHK